MASVQQGQANIPAGFESRPLNGRQQDARQDGEWQAKFSQEQQMSQGQHTPGPWLAREMVSGHWEVCEDDTGDAIARIPATSAEGGNARLIAAAPELLEALEGLFQHCALVHKHWGDGSNADEAQAAIEAAKDAIAKARGSQQSAER